MIQFKSLLIEGFRSFTDPETLHFPKEPGLHLLTGTNLLHKSLTTNGTGKSSVFDALTWNLYGKTARGQKGPDVKNWNGYSPTRVVVALTKNNEEYRIQRIQSPNVLTLQKGPNKKDNKKVEQSVIDSLIGIPYHAFLVSVLMGQFNRFFFDLSPTERLDLFSEILSLDSWIERSDRARAKAKGYEEELTTLKEKELKLNATHDLLLQTNKEWQSLSKVYEKDKKVQVEALEAWVYLRTRDLKGAKEVLDRVKARESRLQGLERSQYDEQKRLGFKIATGDSELTRMTRQHKQYRQELIDLREELYNLTKNPKLCPVCKGPLNKEHRDKELNKAKARVEELTTTTKALMKKIQNNELELSKLDHEELTNKNLLNQTITNLEKATSKERTLAKDYEEQRDRLTRKEQQLQSLKTGVNPYKEKVIKTQHQLEELEQELESITEDLVVTEVNHEQAKTWATLFKELRLWLIEEAVQQLEVETNNHLPLLGLDNWEVKLTIEKESKQGQIQRGFHILIESPDSKKKAKWESWCGGETQRLRIAGAAALQTLIKDRSGTSFNLECWDEPSQHLSEQGIDDLVQFLKQRSEEEQKQIWVVEHHSLASGYFDELWKVVRDRQGSRVIQCREQEARFTYE